MTASGSGTHTQFKIMFIMIVHSDLFELWLREVKLCNKVSFWKYITAFITDTAVAGAPTALVRGLNQWPKYNNLFLAPVSLPQQPACNCPALSSDALSIVCSQNVLNIAIMCVKQSFNKARKRGKTGSLSSV